MITYNLSKVPVFIESGGMGVTSPFAVRDDPITGKKNTPHYGVDIIRRENNRSRTANIAAFAAGTVIAVKNTVPGQDLTYNGPNSAGNYVVIDHGNGWVTRYFHLLYNSISVNKGDSVVAGQRIGTMGSTGYSTGAHLHFQIEKDGSPIDGLPYLLGEKTIFPSAASQDNVPQPWAKEAVEWAKTNGIIFGDENGNLMLREPCTREQMLVFLHRVVKLMGG